ncbi:unnamed protein product [Strongylus vulgaris]|uniref:Uncharacterized protein n=1 Tax=Strongylus vulgaris TaxID=40348 RepID=A0A3P7JBH8_STRVU|nr:unnamed protein product [Strongylus vulgaris]
MLRFYKRSLCLGVTLVPLVVLCSIFAFLKKSDLHEGLSAFMVGPNKLLNFSEDMSENTHLFENTCRYVWAEDEEPSMKGVTLVPLAVFCSILVLVKKSDQLHEGLSAFMVEPNKLLNASEDMSETTHLFENTCRYVWVEDEEPSMKVRVTS